MRNNFFLKKSKIKSLNDVFNFYPFFLIGIFIVTPKEGQIANNLGFKNQSIPIHAWIEGISGSLDFYKDYFFLFWATTPLWLLLSGFIYWNFHDNGERKLTSILIVFSISLATLCLLLFFPLNIEEADPTRQELILILASRSRLIGAFVFGAIAYLIFFLLMILIVKTPIDMWHSIASRKTNN